MRLSQKKRLFIRADATPLIGVGHVLRTLALAQAWQKHGTVTYLSCNIPRWLEMRILQSGCSVQRIKAPHPDRRDLDETIKILSGAGDAWVVLDGYHLDIEYQKELKRSGCRVLLMDDGQSMDSHQVDILVNQNLDAETLAYTKLESVSYLLGSPYILLRNEFLNKKPALRTVDAQPLRLLVTMGGSDPENQSLKILQALSQLNALKFETKLVVGGSNRNRSALEAVARNLDGISLVENVDMALLMSEADLAITAGGSTCWELAYMGVPSLILVVADNQVGIANAIDAAGIAFSLGWANTVTVEKLVDALYNLALSPDRRAHMISRGQRIVDGNGRCRIMTAMSDFNG